MNALEKEVLRIIGEIRGLENLGPDVYEDSNITQIRDSLNDAIEELAVRGGFLKETFRLPLFDTVTFYRIGFTHSQFGYVTSVYLPDKQRLLEQSTIAGIEKHDPSWLTTNNTPQVFAPVGVDKIAIYPSYGEDGHHAEVECAVMPIRYSNDTELTGLTRDLESAPVNYAVAEFFASIGQFDKAGRYQSMYDRYLEEYGRKHMMPDRRWGMSSEPHAVQRWLNG